MIHLLLCKIIKWTIVARWGFFNLKLDINMEGLSLKVILHNVYKYVTAKP